MKTPVKVATYTASLVVVFAAALWLGGRFDLGAEPADTHGADQDHDSDQTDDHGGHDQTTEPGGLSVAADGYRLVTDSDMLTTGKKTEFGFQIIGPDGEPVTSFTPQHEKEIHLIVVRRDLTDYQHLHPETDGSGTWHAPITFAEAGQYRFFADFLPEGADSGLTLGIDVAVAGDYRPLALAEPNTTATVDGYDVTLDTAPAAGEATTLTLTVDKDGEPVTDLEPYLGAYGHLVSLRDGDLAYLHVHPDESETAGPEVSFSTTFPTPGAYRLFFDFQHGDTVRTAEFTVEVTDGSDTDDGHGDGH
ncbi:hypothetical protein FB566_1196 [Stackebrandtia endophytica]|uniref:Secreted protein n=1 Tax=Stackebrandtia endophytica TaxID=1496996 RepID=A0A543AT53_9ACTN|nr:hypothetical protein [Stackebrandtia endophytica]TQL75685.1 hypothetical protein FB566_1196 [Stackebrandtia endophytica]